MRLLCPLLAGLCAVVSAACAGHSPTLFVIVVPDAKFRAIYERLGDVLMEQRAFTNTAERREWVMEGWYDWVSKSNTNVVFKVYCDSVQHVEEGGVKLTDARLQRLREALKTAQATVEVTEDLYSLTDRLGLRERFLSPVELPAGKEVAP